MYLSCDSICLAGVGARINPQDWGKLFHALLSSPLNTPNLLGHINLAPTCVSLVFTLVHHINLRSIILMSIVLYQKALYCFMYHFGHVAMWLYC